MFIKKITNETILTSSANLTTSGPKKRGRKPKNLIDTNNVAKPKTTKKKKDIVSEQNNEFADTKIDVELSKEIDFSADSITENNVEIPNMISNIWINKYQPKTLNEIIGNKDQITRIKKWFSNYDNSNYHAAIISGGHGIGKNLITRLALEESGYQIKNLYSTTLKNKGIVSEIIHSCAKTKNAYTSFNKGTVQKYAVVIDDTESITLSSEKDNLLELFKFNAENRYFPLIFICNLQHSKLINNLKKLSLEITLFAPSVDQIKNYITTICKKEEMNITDDKIYYQIIKFCQSDIRRLIFVLQDLYYTFLKRPITMEMIKEYQTMSQKKDIDVGLYYAAKKLLDNYRNVNESLQLYETEKVLLPLTIYENYYRKIFKQQLLPKQILNIMSNVTDSVSIGDVIETNIYSDQNWFLQNIHGFYTCADTSYTINVANKEIKPVKSKPGTEETKQQIDYNLEFSVDLNKTSSKNINKKKNILPLQSKFKNKNIEDILYINKILFELDRQKSTSAIKTIKETYDLDTKCIQIALKIDKTNDKIKAAEKITKSGKATKSKKKLIDDDDETEYISNEIYNNEIEV
jgi:replication factor C subunit 1